MKGHFYKPNCKCPKGKRCTCGATWSYIVDIGTDPKTGKRKQKKKGGFKTKRDAEIAASILISELEQDTYVDEKNTTFEQFAEEWIQWYQNTGKVKISTVRTRQYEIARLMPYFRKLKMKNISLRQYQNALNDLKQKGYTDGTLDGAHRAGRMIFRKAVELGVIKNDPTEYAYVPKTQKTVEELEQEEETPKYLEKEELALFLSTAKTLGLEMDYEIFLTLAYTGIRAGELCALKETDILESEINITKTYYSPNYNAREYTLLPPKTKTSKRLIEVDGIVIEALKSLITKHKSVKMRYRDVFHDKGFIFINTKKYPGYPIHTKFIEFRMARLLKLAGLDPKLTPHSLRHTHTSLLAEAGVDLEVIMRRLGHSDNQITKDIYLHVTKPKRKEASQKFSELMQGL